MIRDGNVLREKAGLFRNAARNSALRFARWHIPVRRAKKPATGAVFCPATKRRFSQTPQVLANGRAPAILDASGHGRPIRPAPGQPETVTRH